MFTNKDQKWNNNKKKIGGRREKGCQKGYTGVL